MSQTIKSMAKEISAHIKAGWTAEHCIIALLKDIVSREWNGEKQAYGSNLAYVTVSAMRDIIEVLDLIQDALARKHGCPKWRHTK